MYITKTLRLLTITAGLIMTAPVSAQLLKGTIQGTAKFGEAFVGYAPDGYAINEKLTDLKIGSDGQFAFDMPLDKEVADVSIDIEGVGFFGAHLVKGKTVEMFISKTAEGAEVVFKGAEPELNTWYNQYRRSFDSMKYWSPDPSEEKPNATYRQLLEDEYAKLKALAPLIENHQKRNYYLRLAEAQYSWTKIRLLMDEAANKKEDYNAYPEFQALIKDIDINDSINYQTNLSLTAINARVKLDQEWTFEAFSRGQMEIVNREVTNENLRRTMVLMIAQGYFSYAMGQSKEDDERFIADFRQFAGPYIHEVEPMIQAYRERKIAEEKTAAGKAAPDITLQTRDGKEVQLSSLLKGKFTYIDVWATWCGPCCAQIPHLEKLVERFKDNPKVQFVSISTDRNRTAWEHKLDKDKPQWAQYILTEENDAKFAKDWGITGIPRFIMIDADGNIYDANATRPSDPQTEQTIRKNIE